MKIFELSNIYKQRLGLDSLRFSRCCRMFTVNSVAGFDLSILFRSACVDLLRFIFFPSHFAGVIPWIFIAFYLYASPEHYFFLPTKFKGAHWFVLYLP